MTEPRAEESNATGRTTSLSLIERVRDNDTDSWHRLVHLYGPLVYYWCGRAGVYAPDAEDVVRAVAGSLVRFRRDRPGDTFRGWLRGVTRNVLLEHRRRSGDEARAAGGTDAWLRIQGVPAPEDAPDEDDPPGELRGLYLRALELVRAEFEPRTWQAFWRATVDGVRPAEVAAELGMSAAGVRQAKSRILRRLKEEVGDLGE
jgi:RNA polymerase sigma-70 factor (ECF subfamily)